MRQRWDKPRLKSIRLTRWRTSGAFQVDKTRKPDCTLNYSLINRFHITDKVDIMDKQTRKAPCGLHLQPSHAHCRRSASAVSPTAETRIWFQCLESLNLRGSCPGLASSDAILEEPSSASCLDKIPLNVNREPEEDVVKQLGEQQTNWERQLHVLEHAQDSPQRNIATRCLRSVWVFPAQVIRIACSMPLRIHLHGADLLGHIIAFHSLPLTPAFFRNQRTQWPNPCAHTRTNWKGREHRTSFGFDTL